MKIPFERTISGAYRFTFKNILSIIGIGWFPYFLLCLLIGGMIYSFGPQFLALLKTLPEKGNPGRALEVFKTVGTAEAIVFPVLLIISAMVTVGMMRKALGQHPGPVFIFFSLGSQVWRLIGAYILTVLLFWGMAIVLALGIGLIYFVLDKFAHPAAVTVTVLLGIAAVLWVLYAMVRVYFFLPAVVVAENHIGIRRSWHLGRGNFWRIVGIVLIMTIPINLAAQTIMSSILQIAGGNLAMQPGGGPAAAAHLFGAMMTALAHIWPYLLAVQLLYMTIVAGLQSAAVANAYNLVTGGSDIAPPPAKVSA